LKGLQLKNYLINFSFKLTLDLFNNCYSKMVKIYFSYFIKIINYLLQTFLKLILINFNFNLIENLILILIIICY